MDKRYFFRHTLDLMHRLFLKIKYVAPVIFLLVILLIGLKTNPVLGQNIVGTVKTPITIIYDGKTKNFVATQNTVRGALKQAGVSIFTNDISEPSLNSLLDGGKRENSGDQSTTGFDIR